MADGEDFNMVSEHGKGGGTSTRTENQHIPIHESNPFFIAPNENPSLVLVSPHLSAHNYHSWARAMKMALTSKNKFGFVDGSISMPGKKDRKFPFWERCNTLVLSWITRSVSPSIAQSILWIDSAADVWTDLQDCFNQGNILRISDLQDEIYKLKQGESSVTDYFTNLKVLIDELHQFRPIPICSCDPKCKCDVHAKIKGYQDADYTIRFLKGLAPAYSIATSQILMMDPLPGISKVFSMIIQQERKIAAITSQEDAEAVAFTVKTNFKKGGQTPNSRPRCTHCGMLGHTIDKCYKIHGYPPGWGRNKGQAGQPVENDGPHTSQVEARTPDSSRFPCADFPEAPLSASPNKTCKEGSSPNLSLAELASALERPVPDVAMNPQIVKYMSDASFTDMLARIENAITDLGGSLGL